MSAIDVGVKVKRFRLKDLEGAAYNPRKIADLAFQGLKDSIAMFGMIEAPVVNVHGGARRIVSGHQRVSALIDSGIEYADCLVVDMDDATEKAANLTMNNPAIRGVFDAAKAMHLSPHLTADLPRPDFASFDKLVADLRAKADRLAAQVGEEAVDKLAKPPAPNSKVGQTYKLGKHRLFCGGFESGLPKLLGPRKAIACITDPPYNVDYESASGDSIENDAMSAEQWLVFVARVAKDVLRYTKGLSYVFMSSKELPTLHRAWEEAGGVVVRWLFWAKDRFTLGRGDYHHQHEPLLVGCRAGAEHDLPLGTTNVLEFPKPGTNALHPTQKTTALIREIMLACTEPGDLVIDPFVGSGTTISVAEEVGRVCYACELDPRFVDVARRRWAEQVHGSAAAWTKRTPAS